MATKKWSANVTTDSTHPEHNLFNQDAATIAKHLASKKVSPKGPASGMRMLNFYINRAGKNLSKNRHTERHRELEGQGPPFRNHPQTEGERIAKVRGPTFAEEVVHESHAQKGSGVAAVSPHPPFALLLRYLACA